ncbi:HNH endonuclease [Streptomyces sp. CHA1]|uniref:YDG/SRA domain-containing protein n=1 Tax=Streptomyces TaxID=1883 RepID=UPI0004CD43AA|nr:MULTISPECIES: YDG/SRA domain-containing protein [Streptomyces]MBT3157100.1 HNH endonuclease [Streptomyces sp. G11C]MCO6701595.1 HNH endonuclease [Streptomyces sp. CHB9.2]MCO6707847.1 HNH endonuclease [Streptomyces sp. CHA3]MCO6713588.1 HNH endonuclease [Streptomyces sp. CHB19.2]MCO6719918.1 HNH endonuclease [Streptomyces sp. Vc714c-19]
MIGEIPGVPVGQPYASRVLASEAKVHRPRVAGICGTKATGAESIVLSGGYKDDEDLGDVIIYTGHGGQDGAGNQISDQSLDDSGNAALVTSHLQGLPVRVIRGSKSESAYAPQSGYRYDGLYRVVSYGSKLGIDGHLIWQFRMEAALDTPMPAIEAGPLPVGSSQSDTEAPAGNDVPERVSSNVQRIVRSSQVKNAVKRWHADQCQICGITIETPGGTYSEGAHMQALGRPHNGPDRADNVLCLCPNCHVKLDAGAIVIEDDLTVVENGFPAGQLRTHPQHDLCLQCIRSHRERWRR